MNGIINFVIGLYCCFRIYQYFDGQVTPNIFGINVGEIGYIAFFGLFALYCFYGALQSFRARG